MMRHQNFLLVSREHCLVNVTAYEDQKKFLQINEKKNFLPKITMCRTDTINIKN